MSIAIVAGTNLFIARILQGSKTNSSYESITLGTGPLSALVVSGASALPTPSPLAGAGVSYRAQLLTQLFYCFGKLLDLGFVGALLSLGLYQIGHRQMEL
jgi:hypothetical protein